MRERVIFSGAGGQGLLFIGKLFARMMMDKVPFLTFFPSYGAEVRGGTSNCQVVLSSVEIASPLVEEADSLVLMNQPSVDRFLSTLAPGGRAVINSSMADDPGDPRVRMVPASELARQAGNLLAANMVMFGAYLCGKDLLAKDAVLPHIRAASQARGEKVTQINAAAFSKGWEHAAQARGAGS
jgi:2-oxoglutarate ferredoxin oxidoreductase subunit gamma